MIAMLMLRCTLVMLLSSLLHNGSLANLQELAKLKEWAASCHQIVDISIPHELRTSLTTSGPGHLTQMYRAINTFELMLESVNKFPIEGIDELLKRRLQEPLENAISNCKKLEDKVKASGLEDNKKYLESLLSKIRSVAERIGEELNTFMFEVQLELIKKANWTSGNKNELANKFSNLCALAQQTESYCNPESFSRAVLWVSEIGGPPCQPGTKQFVEYLGILILHARLGILKNELSAKIAGFAKQPSHIDGDGFMAFSRNFKSEWNQIEQQMDQVSNRDIASTMERYRTELNDLAESAMEKTASLTDLITLKLDQLVTKCHAAKPEGPMIATKEKGPLKDRIRRWLNRLLEKCKLRNKKEISNLNSAESQHQQQPTDAFLNEEPQFEAKKNEINAKKDIISDIGMFDGAAYKVLVRFEHEELDKTDFSCAELEKAVEKDKEMVLQAYQVKNIDE